MDALRAAAVQFEHVPGDKATNLAIVREFTARAAAAGARLVVFPECCLTGYWHLRRLDAAGLRDLAEPIPGGPATRGLVALAHEFDVIVSAGLIEAADDGRMYNAYVVAMPDGQVACHRKLHCFVNEHLASGDRFTVFDSPVGWRLAVLTCYDNNLVENARLCALSGAEILLAPHQTGGCRSGSPEAMGLVDRRAWERRAEDPETLRAEFQGPKGRGWLMRWLPARAHDNGLFLVFSNGVGVDGEEIRTGNAMILDPYGRILAETDAVGDDMVLADLDRDLQPRSTGRRWLQARRPELYGLLTQRTGRERSTRDVRFDAEG